jgi:hypothetical protein
LHFIELVRIPNAVLNGARQRKIELLFSVSLNEQCRSLCHRFVCVIETNAAIRKLPALIASIQSLFKAAFYIRTFPVFEQRGKRAKGIIASTARALIEGTKSAMMSAISDLIHDLIFFLLFPRSEMLPETLKVSMTIGQLVRRAGFACWDDGQRAEPIGYGMGVGAKMNGAVE